MLLKDIIKIRGQIELKTGLHIGGSKDDIEIGGIDSPVIKTPGGEPYIPGSSLKGKMRSLTEWLERKVSPNGRVHNCSDANCAVCRIFGTMGDGWLFGPTRLVVRDAFMNEEWKKEVREKGLPCTEEKIENWINRLEGKAGQGGLRNIERIPAGAMFDFEMSYKVMEIDGDDRTDRSFFNKVLTALSLVQMDALGGSGSRGYGRIAFVNLRKTEDGRETSLALPTADEIFGRAG